MDGVGPAEGGGRAFRKTQVLDLSFLLELDHCPDRFLYRRDPVQAMAVVEINCRNIEFLETPFARLLHVLRLAACAHVALGVGRDAEFGCEEDVGTLAGAFEPFP